MWVSRYFVLFIIYSCIGWIYETVFCTVTTAKWDNRGVLYGPVCPIYGVGAVSITAICDILAANSVTFTWYQVFLTSFLGSIALEYVTSWGLEKLFHAYWWDYSDMPFNINGRVCLPCSLGFGVAGLVVIYIISPFVTYMTASVTPIMYEVLGLLFMGLIGVDTALTVAALTEFEDIVANVDDNINEHMDRFVENMVDKTRAALAEERERYTRERIERELRRMSGKVKRTVGRVRGFRKSEKRDASRLESMLSHLKDYGPKIK